MGVTINKSQQQQNHRLRTDSSLSHRGGLNAFYWYQIFALDSAVVEVQEMFSFLKVVKCLIVPFFLYYMPPPPHHF